MARKKNGKPLSREHILQTALKLLDEEGMDGLSMRKLAARLDVEAMSLYNHVQDKRDLLSGVTDLALAQIELPEAGLPWIRRLEGFALGLYGTLIRHPALVLVLATEQGGPSQLEVMHGIDSMAAALAESGLSPEQQVNAFRGLLAMCLGFVLAHTQGLSKTREQAEAGWEQWDDPRWKAEGVPHLARLAPYFLQTHADDDFRFMLGAYLDYLKKSGGKHGV